METEEQIVYSIIETVEQGSMSDDIKIDERIVRAFLRTYRASVLPKYSMGGTTISDECFQPLGEVEFTFLKAKQFEAVLPKIIRLESNQGIMLSKNGESIPLVSSESFALGIKNIFNGRLPKAKFLGSKATVYIGEKSATACGDKPKMNLVINDFREESIQSNGMTVTVEVHAILDNPDHSPGYDWTKDPFPCPSELVEEIKTRIYQKEYGIIFQTKTDKITDGNDENESKQNKV